jgi:hypothetical protein
MRNIPLQKLMQDLYEIGDYFASIPPDVGVDYEEEYHESTWKALYGY